ncbi:response regulator PleD [mine drainage metagenome]|uniref:Response regulator PleD n=1 Tax=mine drainage metagenome TaxID=410659 RepID=A0A1J5SL13_9ZZZZ
MVDLKAFTRTLNSKVALFFVATAILLVVIVTTINLYAFRSFSIASSSEDIRTAAEIVRVHLTEAMINGVIDKRASFLKRLLEVQGLAEARVVRSPLVVKQFGSGFKEESPIDDVERRVLRDGVPEYQVVEVNGDTQFRGTIPFIASDRGTPNCLQCHQVSDGSVLGAVTLAVSITRLKSQAMWTVATTSMAIALFAALAFFLIRRMIQPVASTATEVEAAVQRALRGDFKAQVERRTHDEIGQIADDMNRLLTFLDDGLERIGHNVAHLTNRAPHADENRLSVTIDMVDALTHAAHFKQAIEEDETKGEIHQRLARTLSGEFGLTEFSMYEAVSNKNQLLPVFVDGQMGEPCRWCDPEILVRSEACRVRRTGHEVDGVRTPGLCYAFQPPEEAEDRVHYCLPIIQSGSVGNVLQLVARKADQEWLKAQIPYINVYLREAAPVLETKRLMETLRESSLSDPMTGLNNRRFLEEYVETLLAGVQRRKIGLSILMLDLDYFKMVNDTYGHDAGDAVLKALAKVLRQSVRSSDLLIRYGGEEFLIILQETVGAAADHVAETIRASVERMEVLTGGARLKKTISIGVADFPSDSETFWQAVKFADVALYQAKERGRNRVVRFDKDMWGDDKTY